MENRVYTIPLRYSVYSPRTYRTRKAMNIIKNFLERHLKTSMDKIKIGQGLNEAVWSRGMQSPPSKVKVEVFEENEIFKVELFGYKSKEEPKKEKPKEVKPEKKEEPKEEKKKEEPKKEEKDSKIEKDEKKEEKPKEKKPEKKEEEPKKEEKPKPNEPKKEEPKKEIKKK